MNNTTLTSGGRRTHAYNRCFGFEKRKRSLLKVPEPLKEAGSRQVCRALSFVPSCKVSCFQDSCVLRKIQGWAEVRVSMIHREEEPPTALTSGRQHARESRRGGGVTETGWWITSFGAFESTGKNWQVVLHCIKKTYYRKYIVIAKKSSKRMLCPSSLFLDGPLRYVVVASSFTFSGRHCSVILVILSIPTATLLCVLYSVIFTYSLFTPQLFIYWALIFFSWELGWNINNILLSVF